MARKKKNTEVIVKTPEEAQKLPDYFYKQKKTWKERWLYYIWSKHNIFTWLIKIILSLFKKGSILHANGSHLISGYPGSGKTLLMNHILREVDSEKYFFISNIKEFKGVKTFNLEDLFYDGKQQRSIPTIDERGRKLYAIIFDEINLNFNRRMNRTTDYNKLFVGLIEFLVSHRHQGIPRVYFIGQKLELQDTQLQSLFKYQHDIIRTIRWPYYWLYKITNTIEFAPRKLKFVNRVKSLDDEFIEVDLQTQKITRSDLTTYNTHALADDYKTLEAVKIN